MSGRQAFDALGTRIEGQVGHRTPIATFVYPRRLARQGQFANANATGAPVIPVTLRYQRPANSWRPPQHSANNIQRYYQAFDVSVPFVAPDDPIDRHAPGPYFIPPASLVPYRIGRYYQEFVDLIPVTVTPDEPLNRPQRSPYVAPPSLVTSQIRRYYSPQIIDPVPDAPIDRVRPQALTFPPSSIPNRLGRYYQSFDVSVPFVPPDPTPPATGGRGQMFTQRRPLIDDDDVALILALLN